MTSPRLQRILEIYPCTTASGRRVTWDEPSENDSPEIRRHNAFLAKQLQRKRESKDRLKSKGAMSTRDCTPISESDKVTETVKQVLISFRRAYQSNRHVVSCF